MKKYLITILILMIALLFIVSIIYLFFVKTEMKPYCGDGICQANEDFFSCPKDCEEASTGIRGLVTVYTGNCMPGFNNECIKTNVSTKIKIYPPISEKEIIDSYYKVKEGWYRKCSGDLIKEMPCDKCIAICDAIGSRSEGWYSVCGNEKKLIVYDLCAKSTCNLECRSNKPEPLFTVESNPFYEILLPKGNYSVLVEDPLNKNEEYCNYFSSGYACPVFISDNFVEFNIMINHATW